MPIEHFSCKILAQITYTFIVKWFIASSAGNSTGKLQKSLI